MQSGQVQMTIRNYDGVNDFTFPRVTISTSVGTGLGALAEEINRVADKTGVRASFNVQTAGSTPIKAGVTSEDFTINGVIIGKVEYKDSDGNGALIAAINSKKDTTGVEATRDANGQLLLTSNDGRGIKIEGSIGQGAGIPINMLENYGRLSLVKNDGGDISVSGTGFGFDDDKLVSQASVSLRETKGKLSQKMADAMGFNSFEKIATITIGVSSITVLNGTGLSVYTELQYLAGSGLSQFTTSQVSMVGHNIDIGPGLGQISNMSLSTKGFSGLANIISSVKFSNVYTVALSQVSTVNGELVVGSAQANGLSLISALGVVRSEQRQMQIGFEQTAGVTTLTGAMAVMDVAETAIINLDQVRADIGSVQNQLQVTVNNISVTQVNLKSAESTIRDVDFAAESANFSKNNILAQSGSYALAQANASQQHVLQLLQ